MASSPAMRYSLDSQVKEWTYGPSVANRVLEGPPGSHPRGTNLLAICSYIVANTEPTSISSCERMYAHTARQLLHGMLMWLKHSFCWTDVAGQYCNIYNFCPQIDGCFATWRQQPTDQFVLVISPQYQECDLKYQPGLNLMEDSPLLLYNTSSTGSGNLPLKVFSWWCPFDCLQRLLGSRIIPKW